MASRLVFLPMFLLQRGYPLPVDGESHEHGAVEVCQEHGEGNGVPENDFPPLVVEKNQMNGTEIAVFATARDGLQMAKEKHWFTLRTRP